MDSDRFSTYPYVHRLPGWVLPLFLLIFSIVYYSIYIDHGLILNDEGHLVHFSERILSGQVPGRDFHLETYIYGRYAILAFLFHIFGGPNLIIERAMWFILRIFCVLIHFSIARRFMPNIYALLPSLFFLLLPGPWHKTFYSLCTLLGLLSILVFLSKPSIFRVSLLAVVSAISIQLRQDIGLMIIIVSLSIIIVNSFSKSINVKKTVNLIYYVLIYIVVIALSIFPAIWYLHEKNALLDVFNQCFIEKFKQHVGLFDFTYRLNRMWITGDHIGVLYFLLPFPLFIVSIIYILYHFIRGSRKTLILPYSTLLIISILSINQAYNHTLVIRLLQSSAPTYILFVYISWRAILYFLNILRIDDKSKRAWIFVGAPSLIGILLFLISIEIMTSHRESNLGVEYRGSIATYSKRNIPIESKRAKVYVEPHKAKTVNDVLSFINKNTSPNESIYVASNDSIFYFLSERSNPTRFAKFFMPGEAPERALQIASEVKKHPVELVITTTRLWHERKNHPAVKYLKQHYRIVKIVDKHYQKKYMVLQRIGDSY